MRAAALAVVLLASPAYGQAPASFEAASIKPNTSGVSLTTFQIRPGGAFVAVNATVRDLVRMAYQLEFETFQILGGPWWIDTERFDVQATAGARATPAEVSALVRQLLNERFKMTSRREKREMPVFRLVVADANGRLGPGLTPARECAPAPPPRPDSAPPPGTPLPDTGGRPRCGFGWLDDVGDLQRFRGFDITIDELATRLRQYAGSIVINGSGLSGRYDFSLDFMPRSLQPQDVAAGVSIFTAVQEQLGLKLETSREQVDVLVIDRLDRPTEN